jgi:hypothetical protein
MGAQCPKPLPTTRLRRGVSFHVKRRLWAGFSGQFWPGNSEVFFCFSLFFKSLTESLIWSRILVQAWLLPGAWGTLCATRPRPGLLFALVI